MGCRSEGPRRLIRKTGGRLRDQFSLLLKAALD